MTHDTETTARKLRRFLVVTAIASPANLALYVTFLAVTNWPAVAANLAAATVITPPAFLACRNWVWRVEGEHSIRAEAIPYWLSTVFNLACSTLALWALERNGAGAAVLAVAPVAVYGALWIVRFVFLDRILFAAKSERPNSQPTSPRPSTA